MCMRVTLTSQMHIPPSMPVVQNLVHWFRPPSSTEISLKYLFRQVKLCVPALKVAEKTETQFNGDDALKQVYKTTCYVCM